MSIKAYKYFSAFTIPLMAIVSFNAHGFFTFSTLIYGFVLLPFVEYVIGERSINLDKAQAELAKNDRIFDVIIYLTVPAQVICLFLFLNEIAYGHNTLSDLIGKTSAMGIMCGVFGINIAHELGHRNSTGEKILSKIMLCTSLYMHFYIEHNRGHHRNVGTKEDPATALKNESVYTFWMRSLPLSFLSAWNIVKKERSRKKLKTWSWGNEMIQYLLIEFLLCAVIGFYFGMNAMFFFLIAAFIGMLLLETVNYIEHYGLYRKKVSEFRYEDVEPKHSWNSDYIIGRIFLFELTRHSDHHWEPSKHYQLLDSMPKASQLPAGYPAMMLLSLVPPMWFRVMNPRLPA